MEFTKHKLEKWESYGLSNDLIAVYKSFLDQETNSRYITEYFKNLQSLYKYQEEWDLLAEEFGNPLLHSSWFIAGAKAFPVNSELTALTLHGNKLAAAAPIALKGKIFPHIEVLGSSILREPTGFLYDSHRSLELLIKTLLDTQMPIYLRGLYKNSEEVKTLEQQLKLQISEQYWITHSQIPYVDIRESWESFEMGLSSSRRSNFRRLLRRAEKQGKLEFKAITPTEKNVDAHLDELFRVEASNWKGRVGTAINTHPTLNVFFREYGKIMAQRGQLRLFFMLIDDKAVAVQFAVEFANKLWIFKIGYDEKWGFCSPGMLLMHHTVQYCFDRELRSCEFLGNDDDWLHIWANEVHEMVSYHIYPKSINGALAKFQDRFAVFYHNTLNHTKYRWRGSKKENQDAGKTKA